MRLPKLLYSFRTRLLLVLATVLVSTLVFQYYLEQLEHQRRTVIIAEQEQALAASMALALESITSRAYMFELDEKRPTPFLSEQKGRVMNILVVRGDGRIDDSLDPQYLPKEMDDGTAEFQYLSEVGPQLPKLVEAGQPTDELRQLLGRSSEPIQQTRAGAPRAFPIPVQTDKGLNYIIVVLGAARTSKSASWLDEVEPYLPLFTVLLLATLAATFLVWRFTSPIKALSRATQRVASGHFDFTVEGGHRRDETGALVATFNEMVAGLGHMRELEAKVKQAEQSAVVGRLASAIAHEIRNPLNYINLTLDHLRTSLAPEDPHKRETFSRLADQIKTEVARINTRITEFLKYTRPAKLELQPLDIEAVAADALRMIEVQAEETGVRTDIEREGALPLVLGDRESLRSLFTNLIINGMQAIEGEGGRLTVRLSSDDGIVRVDISDTGRGIETEDLPKIFEPYFSTKDTGTGLGLAIAKKAVDDHGGHITVTSKRGEGTTFTVTLPIGGRG